MNYKKRKIYNKKSKIFLSVIIAVGVLGLGIGFAAFTNTLNISSNATVNPSSSDFKVLFSSSSTKLVDGTIDIGYHTSGTSGANATINNSNPTSPKITGIKATFTKPGGEVHYDFYVRNEGKYTAYLKNITFGSKKCIAKTGTTQALVDAACDSIVLHIRFGTDSSSDLYNVRGNKTVSNHPLEKGASEQIKVWIGYYGSALADGEFDITFGDITLTYSTIDA